MKKAIVRSGSKGLWQQGWCNSSFQTVYTLINLSIIKEYVILNIPIKPIYDKGFTYSYKNLKKKTINNDTKSWTFAGVLTVVATYLH